MRVFSYACWPNMQPYLKNKFNFQTCTCIFLGYSLCHHGYKCYDPTMGKTYISRHVIFDKTLFPLIPQFASESPSNSSVPLPSLIHLAPPSHTIQLQMNSFPIATQFAHSSSSFAGTGDEILPQPLL